MAKPLFRHTARGSNPDKIAMKNQARPTSAPPMTAKARSRSSLLAVNLGVLQVQLANKLSTSKANEAEIAEKSQKVEELSNMLKKSGDPEFIENAARERLGYVCPNEKVFYDVG